MKITKLLVVAVALSLSACSVKNSRMSSTAGIDQVDMKAASQSELESRIQTLNSSLPLANQPGYVVYSSNIPEFSHISTILPPKVSNIDPRPLRATSSIKVGNRLFVSYLLEGESVAGALDILDISSLNQPLLIASYKFSNMEFSDVRVKDTAVYLVGSKKGNGAVMVTMDISNVLSPTLSKYTVFPGDVATSMDMRQGQLIVGSAQNGGLSYFNLDVASNPQFIKYEEKSNVLAVKALLKNDNDASGDITPLVLYGQNSTALSMEGNYVELASVHSDAPSRFITVGPLVYAVTAQGLSVTELTDKLYRPFVRTIPVAGQVHGVGHLDQKLYVAAGDKGLRLIDVQEPGSPHEVGYIDFEDNGSANNVWVERIDSLNKLIILADGQSGIRLLREEVNPVDASSKTIKIHAKSTMSAGLNGKLVVLVNDVQAGDPIDVSSSDFVTYSVEAALPLVFGDQVKVVFYNDDGIRNMSIAYVKIGEDFFYQWHNNYFYMNGVTVHNYDSDNILMDEGGYLKLTY